jgi:hypothetical protein
VSAFAAAANLVKEHPYEGAYLMPVGRITRPSAPPALNDGLATELKEGMEGILKGL